MPNLYQGRCACQAGRKLAKPAAHPRCGRGAEDSKDQGIRTELIVIALGLVGMACSMGCLGYIYWGI